MPEEILLFPALRINKGLKVIPEVVSSHVIEAIKLILKQSIFCTIMIIAFVIWEEIFSHFDLARKIITFHVFKYLPVTKLLTERLLHDRVENVNIGAPLLIIGNVWLVK